MAELILSLIWRLLVLIIDLQVGVLVTLRLLHTANAIPGSDLGFATSLAQPHGRRSRPPNR